MTQFAIYTPTHDSSTPPSMQYTFVGDKDPSSDIADSIATAVAFDSRADFDRFIADADAVFWSRR
jgi:hypothetical protein